MTDKEIIERAKEAEKRTGFGELVYSPISKGVNSAFGIGFIEGMVEYRNSMQDAPVSEDLDTAIGEYCTNPDNFISYIDTGFAYRSEQKDDIPLIIKAIKFGAKWQKELMMKDAIETIIIDDWQYGKDKDHATIPAIHQRIDGFNVGDKVKVIILNDKQL